MKTYELLSNSTKWTRYTLARTSEGKIVAHDDPQAYSFSIDGALFKCYANVEFEEFFRIYNKVWLNAELCGGESIEDWNDDPKRTFADVHTFLKKLNV